MGGFRRAQLRGSDELFRTTDDETVATVTRPAPADVSAVPNAPEHDSRSIRLSATEIELIVDALQHLKFPNKPAPRPSMDDFETLEELRQRLLDAV